MGKVAGVGLGGRYAGGMLWVWGCGLMNVLRLGWLGGEMDWLLWHQMRPNTASTTLTRVCVCRVPNHTTGRLRHACVCRMPNTTISNLSEVWIRGIATHIRYHDRINPNPSYSSAKRRNRTKLTAIAG